MSSNVSLMTSLCRIFLGLCPSLLLAQESSKGSDDQSAALTLLRDRCLSCHNDRQAEGGYSLTRIHGLLRPGDSGARPIVFGQPTQSELIRRVMTDDEEVRMPSKGPKLSDQEIALLQRWIESSHPLAKGDETSLIDWIGGKDKILLTTGEPLQPTYAKNSPNPVMAFDAKLNRLYVGGVGEIVVWDVIERRIVARWTGLGRHISSIQVHSSGNWVAIASGNPSRTGTIHIVDTHEAGVARIAVNLSDIPVAMSFSPDAPILAIGCLDGTLKLFDVSLHRLLMDVAAHADQVLAVNWKSDGKEFISGSRDRTARVYDYPTMDLKVAYSGHERAIGGVGITDYGAVVLDETGTLRLWARGDSDRMLIKRTGLPQRLQGISTSNHSVTWMEESRIVTAEIQRREEDQGKDQDGKPKTKKVHELVLTHFASIPAIPLTAWVENLTAQEFLIAGRDGWLYPSKSKAISDVETPDWNHRWRIYP